ncbi:zinc finger A20 and AN1 domain-containing stress-associated protein [Sesbania bispinosa]|nr:zinc finger A20 and AN1 domain-containing stress-associated protein [Sesbania bispinosa]
MTQLDSLYSPLLYAGLVIVVSMNAPLCSSDCALPAIVESPPSANEFHSTILTYFAPNSPLLIPSLYV